MNAEIQQLDKINVLGPFLVKKETGNTLDALKCKMCIHEKLDGPPARLNVCFSPGENKRKIKFRARVTSVVSLSRLFCITDVGPSPISKSRIILAGGEVKGIGRFQFAVLEINDENPADGEGTITFYTGQENTRYQRHLNVEIRVASVKAKNEADRLDILLSGNSLILRGLLFTDRFEQAQFWLKSLPSIIKGLEVASSGGAKNFTALAVFFGNIFGKDRGYGQILFKTNADNDIVDIVFQKTFNMEIRRESDPIRVSLSGLLREMRRTQEMLMLFYGWL